MFVVPLISDVLFLFISGNINIIEVIVTRQNSKMGIFLMVESSYLFNRILVQSYSILVIYKLHRFRKTCFKPALPFQPEILKINF